MTKFRFFLILLISDINVWLLNFIMHIVSRRTFHFVEWDVTGLIRRLDDWRPSRDVEETTPKKIAAFDVCVNLYKHIKLNKMWLS